MPQLTLFTAPKPFRDPHINTIQSNAIRSWLQLGPEVEVFLVGNEEGMTEVADEFGLRHFPDVDFNRHGTPLIPSIFDLARQASTSPLLAYLNADILVFPDFLGTARQVARQAERFLVVGQRWDLDIRRELDFSPGWEMRLREELHHRGLLHRPAGSDYFIFPGDQFTELPPFAIGRAGWDNWMIYHARNKGWPVIDATPSLQIIHQDHDYSHLPGGKPHYDLEETQENMEMAGGAPNMYTILDTDKQWRRNRIVTPRPTLLRLLRRAEVWLSPDEERRGRRWALARQFRRMRRRLTGSL